MSSLASLPQPSAFVTKDYSDVEAQARSAGWTLPTHLENAHVSRQTEWLASRLCLSEAFRELGLAIEPSRVRFLNHQEIEGEPGFRFSFSHTRERAGCWLVDRRHPLTARLAVGLDLELPSRAISSAVLARLNIKTVRAMHELERWCLREAVFKSLTPSQQRRFTTLSIEISVKDDFRIPELNLDGLFHIEMNKNFVAAFAWSTIDPN